MAKLRVDKIAAPIVKDEFTGSVYFDGTGDYLQMPDSSDFAFGAEDYSIELWIYSRTLSAIQRIFGQRAADAGSIQMLLETSASGVLSYYFSIGDSSTQLGTTAVTQINTWHHIAITRLSGTHTLYVDGVSVATNSTSGSLDDRAEPFSIGRQGDFTSNNFNGYISNFRICKGHAVYTGNFTVPTRELPVHKAPPKGVVFPAADNLTVLLACQSSTDAILDSSGRHTITANGNATAADANPGLFRKTNITSTITENTGSVFFDGDGDYLSIADSDDFSFGSGDFTIEGFIYPTGIPHGTYATLVTPGYSLQTYFMNSNSLSLFVSSNGSSYDMISTANATGTDSIFQNKWSHFALTRSGDTFRYFINGIEKYTNTVSGAIHNDSTPLGIGDYAPSLGSFEFQGYMSNIRICKGHAVYTSQFTPPTRELEVHSETVLLCCHDGENIFADKSGRHIIAAYGDRLSSPTPTATDSPIGITTHNPGLTKSVDPTAGPIFQGGAGFVSQNWLTLPKGTTTERMPVFGGVQSGTRGFFAGAYSPSRSDLINYVTVPTLGNAIDFGNLSTANGGVAGFSDSTRGWIVGVILCQQEE